MIAAAPAGESACNVPFVIDVSANLEDEYIGGVGAVSEPVECEPVGEVRRPGVTTGSPFPR
jgi:hypothetical protein